MIYHLRAAQYSGSSSRCTAWPILGRTRTRLDSLSGLEAEGHYPVAKKSPFVYSFTCIGAQYSACPFSFVVAWHAKHGTAVEVPALADRSRNYPNRSYGQLSPAIDQRHLLLQLQDYNGGPCESSRFL